MSGIIVGADGSAHSRRAMEWAIREAGIRRTPLTVLTVQQAVVDYWSMATFPGEQELADQARKGAQKEAEDILAQLGDEPQPLSVTIQGATGLPAEELIKAAADTDAEMIVVGSRGAGGFRKLLLGSVSTQLTHHAHCPVMIIPPEERR
jgi:nucleotide-binding universal stress UspA family protein